MTRIDQSTPLQRTYGSFETLTPLIQSTPADRKSGEPVETRVWRIAGKEIPVISGDSIRGRMRRILAHDMLLALGVEPGSIPLSVGQLLMVGGSLGNLKNTLTQEAVAGIRADLPMLALLGGTPLGGFLHGRLRAGAWVAQTVDTPSPALVRTDEEKLPSAQDVLMEERFARASMADERSLWAPDPVGERNASTSRRRGKEERDADAPMPFSLRVVVPGVSFAGWIGLADYRGLTPEDDAVQRSCLRYAIERAYPSGAEVTLGLRASSGYGVVSFSWDDLSCISDEAVPGERYLEHLDANRDRLVEGLCSDELVPKPAEKKDKKEEDKASAETPDEASSDAEEGEESE